MASFRPLRSMRGRLLGTYVPGRSWLHRLPALAALAGVAALSVVVLWLRQPLVNAGVIGLVLALGLTAGLRWRELLGPLVKIWWVLALIALAQVLLVDAATGLRLVSGIVACVLAAGLLMLTCPLATLLDALVTLARPLRWCGGSPERAGLAATLMLRSIPVLADLAQVSGRSAKARGLERNLRARTVPVALGAVAHARDTARALTARGLD